MAAFKGSLPDRRTIAKIRRWPHNFDIVDRRSSQVRILTLLSLTLAALLPIYSQIQPQSAEPVRVKSLTFVGNKRISGDDLVTDLKNCLEADWELYDANHYKYCTEKSTRGLMRSRGYLRGKIIDVKPRPIAAGSEITITVDEGVRYRWGKITVEGSTKLSGSEIIDMFGQKPGEIANARDFSKFLNDTLALKYKEMGYVQFEADADHELIDPTAAGDDGVVNVSITIDEGRVFTVRKIKFTGVEPSEQANLLRSFPLRPGSIYVQSAADKGIADINALQTYEFVDKDQDVQLLLDNEANDIDLIIKLKKLDR